MSFAVTTLILSLCMPFLLGLGGCRNYQAFHDERHRRIITDTTAKLERKTYDAGLYTSRGWAYYCVNQYEKAISDFNRAIEIDSENASAYKGRGITSKIIDYQALEVKGVPYHHNGYVEDTKKADRLEPGKLEEETNQGFGYISNVSNEFIYPVSGDCFAESNLILGSTTKTQAVEMLPSNWWYKYGATRVYRPTKPSIGKVGKVVKNARYLYQPEIGGKYFTLYQPVLILVFDKKNKLVVIRTSQMMSLTGSMDEREMQIARKRKEKFQDLMRQHQFTEVYRDEENPKYGEKTMRAEITPCLTVDIEVPIEPDSDYLKYTTIEYIYTCPTK